MIDDSKIRLFVRENYKFLIPAREDLFLRQIEVLDRDYNLKEKWESFNSMLEQDFEGNPEKFDEAREQYCTELAEYYKQNKVAEKVANLIQDRNYTLTDLQKEQLPGHTYLKVDLVHAFNQVLEYFQILPETEEQLKDQFTPYSSIRELKIPRIVAVRLGTRWEAMQTITEQLLRKAIEPVDNPLFTQLQTAGIPIIRKDVDDFIYDITGFEDTFSSFIGQQVSNGVNLHVSMFKQDSMIFYYDYALHIAPVQIDWVTGQKDFGGFEFREFLPQLACIDQGWPISEKDLWWQDRDGLHRHNKPIRQVLLGPETVVE